jgi:hypothetical protein
MARELYVGEGCKKGRNELRIRRFVVIQSTELLRQAADGRNVNTHGGEIVGLAQHMNCMPQHHCPTQTQTLVRLFQPRPHPSGVLLEITNVRKLGRSSFLMIVAILTLCLTTQALTALLVLLPNGCDLDFQQVMGRRSPSLAPL